jgi:uncharacterized damage-inducible protein DinB
MANSRSFLLDPPDSPIPAALAFLRNARFRLLEDYLVKIAASIGALTDDQIWWRPNDASNSIGNLVLHLCGNARQWIVAGVGGAADTRDRPSEFAGTTAIAGSALINLLGQALGEVNARLVDLENELVAVGGDGPLQRVCRPQGFNQTVFDAVFHVVEHFSYHTGQIVLLAKWHAGDRIRLYDDVQLNVGRSI